MSSEITVLSGSGGGVEMAEEDESVVSTLIVELDPETVSPRNLIIPRHSVGTPPDRDGNHRSRLRVRLRGRERNQRQRVNQVPNPLKDCVPEQLSSNVHQNPRKLHF